MSDPQGQAEGQGGAPSEWAREQAQRLLDDAGYGYPTQEPRTYVKAIVARALDAARAEGQAARRTESLRTLASACQKVLQPHELAFVIATLQKGLSHAWTDAAASDHAHAQQETERAEKAEAALAAKEAELARVIAVAGEAVGTDPALRSSGCVDALATWAGTLQRDLSDVRAQLAAQQETIRRLENELTEIREDQRDAAIERDLSETD